MRIDRRKALSLLALGAAASTASCGRDKKSFAGTVAFNHGVASGDPGPSRVILWTRVTPVAPSDPATIPVQWEIAADPAFATLVKTGTADAGPVRDYTVKIDADGLEPGHDYYYRFRCGMQVSPIGRVHMLVDDGLDEAVLAFVSCNLYPGGLFNAYDAIAKLPKVNAVIHLGDYIYEYGAADTDYGMETGRKLGRIPDPQTEILTLADYRRRHAQYKSDADLQAAHARAPWICVWDDHEVANDSWLGGAENHDKTGKEGSWADRKDAALRAYFEWMPIREPQPGRAEDAINRSFQFGKLATLIMIETRLTARTLQLSYLNPGEVTITVYDATDPKQLKKVTDPSILQSAFAAVKASGKPPAPYILGPDVEAFEAKRQAPERELMGQGQREWFAQTLKDSVASGSAWQILGNQVVMARVMGPDLSPLTDGSPQATALFQSLPAPAKKMVSMAAPLFAFGMPFNLDSWDGYPAERERVYAAFRAAKARPVVVSGDSHAFWANELHDANGTLVAAEFGTSGVTSPSIGDGAPQIDLGGMLNQRNDEVVFCDQHAKGYTLLTVTANAVQAELVAVSTILAKPYDTKAIKRYRVQSGADRMSVAPLEDITPL